MSIRVGFTPTRLEGPSPRGRHLSLFESSVTRDGVMRRVVVGALRYSAADLLALRAEGARLHVLVVGRLRLDRDVTEELAASVIAQVRVIGSFRAPEPVKRRLA